MGFNNAVEFDGLVNQNTFVNNGNIFTSNVGVPGSSALFTSSNFTNNGNIDIAVSPANFGFTVISGGLLTNNGNITTATAAQGIRIQGANSEVINNNTIS